MNKLQQRVFTFLPAVILLINQILIMFIRPVVYKSEYILLSEILGWLPNYLASLGFMLIGMLLIFLIKELKLDKRYSKYYNIYMIFISIIALIGFSWWEFNQKQNSLIFDLYDIYATFCGVITGYLIFIILHLKHKLIN